jgi:hypothetical protein
MQLPYNESPSLGGRPSKRNADIEKKLLDALSNGLPYRAACGLAGISTETLRVWRRDNPSFEQAVQFAEARAVERDLANVREAGRDDWRASAWALERRCPAEFGSAQVQLNQQINIANTHLGLTELEVQELFRVNQPQIDALLNGTLLPPDGQEPES